MRTKTTTLLAIETSCDDTGVALLRSNCIHSAGKGICDSIDVLAEQRSSQIDIHTITGGVVPEVAARAHVESMTPMLQALCSKSNIAFNTIDGICVTNGPGLIPSLLVGTTTAKTLAYAWSKPVFGVHHIEAHMMSVLLSEPGTVHALKTRPFPWLFFVVSGGHTQFVYMRGIGQFEIIGRTRDDAAGEAFDKAAKMLGLGYPGGPVINTYAAHGDAQAFELPRPMIHDPSFDMSFSGLKTALRVLLEKKGYDNGMIQKTDVVEKRFLYDLCASFQSAIVDVCSSKASRALQELSCGAFCLVGGVAANTALRQSLEEVCKKQHVMFAAPPLACCSDNALMVGAAGLVRWCHDDAVKHLTSTTPSWRTIDTQSRPPLQSWSVPESPSLLSTEE